MMKISVILLCGGKGVRLGSPIPKQYLPLAGKPIARYSFDQLSGYGEMIVVAHPEWRNLFNEEGVLFAEPGMRRQDSVYNGLQQASGDWILVHDAARPFATKEDIDKLLKEAFKVGAACLASPVKNTLKFADADLNVLHTPDRSTLWEIETPQVVRKDILLKGFEKAHRENLTVTDDVSLAELVLAPVKLVQGKHGNVKITTTHDFAWAEWQAGCQSKLDNVECLPTN